MEFFVIFIPIDMDSIEVKMRDTIRAYFIFLICIIIIGISIFSFSRGRQSYSVMSRHIDYQFCYRHDYLGGHNSVI